jgi:L-2-hydroxyglutarate oxidase LhgO
MSGELYDVAVVGAGIVGLAVTKEIVRRHPELRVVVVDREMQVGAHQTSHNSGVIHSGIYYKPGSLKARLCTEGAALMYEYAEANGIPYERCGKLIVAVDESQLEGLDELERRGTANGVQGLRRLTAAEIPQIEPEARGIAALHSPNTGIIDYGAVARSVEAELRQRGVDFELGTRIDRVIADDDVVELEGAGRAIRARVLVTCAGLWSDRIAVAAGAPADPKIMPFRGGYLEVAHSPTPVLRGLVYPVPDPDLPFLGVHVSKHIDGSVSLGPTALLVLARDAYRITKFRVRDVLEIACWPGSWRLLRHYWRTALSEVLMAVSPKRFARAGAVYVPAVERLGIVGSLRSGVRAQALGRDGKLVDDFVISETKGAFHVRNAPSPAATSSFAIGRYLADTLEESTVWARLKG